MDSIAEFEGTQSVSKRTPRIFGIEKEDVAGSSRTLRRRGVDFIDYMEPEGVSIPEALWSRRSNPNDWRNVGTSRVRTSEAVGNLLGRFYGLREPEETVDFVTKDAFLLQWLLRLYPKVRKHFPGSKQYLEVVSDPEVEDVRLVNFVKVDHDPSEAIQRLDNFDKEWSSIVPKRVDQKLTITVEF